MSNNGDNKLDVLIDQVGRLTERTTEFRADMVELKAMIREQNEISKRQAESIQVQAEVSKRQAETVDRLVKVVESLIAK